MTRMVLIFLLLSNLYAAPTELGNGNDGKDLLEFKEIEDGIIWETRKEAVKLLSQINLRGIQGLGYLKDEVEKTKLYITIDGLSSQELLDLGAFKTGDNPIVYARTYPRPHAPTRFFPAARSLSRPQLVAVHIHEGLHRSLPESIRTDEEIVEDITKVIVSPEATFDDILLTMNRHLPQAPRENKPIELMTNTSNQKTIVDEKTLEVTLGLTAFDVINLPLWNSSFGIDLKETFFEDSRYEVDLFGSYHSLNSGFSGGSSDKAFLAGVRHEHELKDNNTISYQASFAAISSNVYGNPLQRPVLTGQVDYTKNYGVFALKAKLSHTLSSSGSGSLAVLNRDDVDVSEYDDYEALGGDIYSNDEAVHSGITSLDLVMENYWTEGFTTSTALTFHSMRSYSSSYTHTRRSQISENGRDYTSVYYDTVDHSSESFPLLAVAQFGMDYKWKDYIARFNYQTLLGSPTDSTLGEVDLSYLGDVMGRGVGKSSLSLSLTALF